MSLDKLFNPKSIAIVGASSEEGKVGNVIAKNILNLGYTGQVYLVNPKHNEILGQKCYKSLAEIKEDIDLAVVAIPAKFVNEEIKNNADKIKNFVVISAGFSEIGPAGKKLEKELSLIAQKEKVNILGPNCLGFIVPSLKLNASFAGGMPETGNISFVSQSGALAVAMMDMAKKEGMKFSNIVSVGNKMEIGELEMLEFLAQDKNTKVIGMYLEGISDGKKFIEVAQKISLIKPIVILKAGKNEKTQEAISSHTGALAGDDQIVSAVFKKAGIIRANNLEEFFNTLNLISFSEEMKSGRTAIITNAGGVGVLTADSFNEKNIKLADFPSNIKEELKKLLPKESSVENPIDLLGDAKEDRYKNILQIISKIEDIGAVICLLTPQDQTPVEKITNEIVKFKNESDKIVATVFLGGERVKESITKLKENGVCHCAFPDLAINALDNYYRWSEFKKSKDKSLEQIINKKRQAKVKKIIRQAKAEHRQALYFDESAQVMEMYGIKTIESFNVKNYKKTEIKYPVALKIDSDKILHKTDKNGLILNIKDEESLARAISQMQFSFPGNRLIIQPMAKSGMEIILGIKKDENFGPIVVYGLGGIYTEFLKMVDYLVPPASLKQVEDNLNTGKIKFLFQGARGQKKYNLEEIAKILMGLSSLALEIAEIAEFDINPLVIYNNGDEALALDVKIII